MDYEALGSLCCLCVERPVQPRCCVDYVVFAEWMDHEALGLGSLCNLLISLQFSFRLVGELLLLQPFSPQARHKACFVLGRAEGLWWWKWHGQWSWFDEAGFSWSNGAVAGPPSSNLRAFPLVHQGTVVGRWLLMPWTWTPRATARNPNPLTYTSNYTPCLEPDAFHIPVTHDGMYVVFTHRVNNFPFQSAVRFHRQLALDLRHHFHTPMPAATRHIHVHHQDHNYNSNDTSNLRVLTSQQHRRLHPTVVRS